MHPTLRLTLSTALGLAATAGLAGADVSKLDPRARIALRVAESVNAPGGKIHADQPALNAENELDVFIVGDVSRAELEAAGATIRTEIPGASLYTAYIPAAAVEQVAALAGVSRIIGAAPCEMENNAGSASTLATLQRGAGPTFTGANGAGVLVGDVDSGIDYGHEDFDDAGGNTRLVNIWDQTVATGPNPAGFAYGTEWTPAQINANTCTQTDVSQHGTHVMGSAGGDGSATGAGSAPAFTYAGVAPMADLCMVKTNFQTTGVLDGVTYILNRGTALGKNTVVNLSLGSHFGPHDGTSPFESGLSALTGPGRIIVKSAGNERGVAQHAEVFAAGTGTNATMTIAGSANNRIVGIDGYFEASENINVEVTTPGGTVLGPYTVGTTNAAYPGVVTTNGAVYVENGAFLTATGDKQVYIEIRGLTGASANGTWTFRFIPVALGAAAGEVDLWRFFQSTGMTGNFAIGNQATEELVSEPGNAVNLITVAAWSSKVNWTACTGTLTTFTGTVLNTLASFSSPGPTRDGRQKPDIAAPGIAIISSRSDDLVQNCPASGASTLLPGLRHIANAGTSMAAPHVSGAVALLMQKFGAITPAFAKMHLTADALVDGNTGAVWNKDWGNGKLRVDVTNPNAAVTVPDGGEIWTVGSNQNITWTASDPIISTNAVTITIALSRTGLGGPFSEVLASNIVNTGTFGWVVTGPITTNAAIRVTAVDPCTNQGTDISNAVFTIANPPVPVELAAFTAETVEGGVKLRWKYTDDSDFATTAVERSTLADGGYELLAAKVGNEGGQSVVVDETAEPGLTYFYRLVATERTGNVTRFGPLSAISRGFTKFALAPAWPNPTSGNSSIEFTVPVTGKARLVVYDVSGRVISTVADGDFTAGKHRAEWAGGTDGGAPAANGIYYISLESPNLDSRVVQRITLAR
jgi:subtilisin family serine protease